MYLGDRKKRMHGSLGWPPAVSWRLVATAVALASVAAVHAVEAKTAEQIYAEVSPRVVLVLGSARDGDDSLGSGVVVAHERVATNCHVLRGQEDVVVIAGSEELDARLHSVDWGRDVCILQVPGLTATPVRLGTIQHVRIGQKVYAIGSPSGLESTLSDGLVSAFRNFSIGTVIQISAPISPGSSGGGLFDEQGTLIGLTTSGLDDAQNLNFAHPVDWISELLAKAGPAIRLSPGEAPRPPAESSSREAAPPPRVTPVDPPVSASTAALIEHLFFTDVRFETVNGTPTVVGTVRSRAQCTIIGLRVRAAFRAGPYSNDPVVHSMLVDLIRIIEPGAGVSLSFTDPVLSGHTESSPSGGRWWVRMNVVNVDEVSCP